MTTVSSIILPLVPDMPIANWRIGTRTQPPRYFTGHYNGPKVPGFGYPKLELAQLRSDARYHMRPGAFGVRSGGDGIQYHGATLSDGTNWKLRDFDAILWHCGNYEGNQLSISWHLPFGEGQQPTNAQLQGFFNVIAAFRRQYPTIAVTGVKGHLEWKKTLCPGVLQPHIANYRINGQWGKPTMYYTTIVNANCRQAPDVGSPVALNGTAVTPAGTTFAVDAIVQGVPYQGDASYVHRADGIGFYHMSVVKPAM